MQNRFNVKEKFENEFINVFKKTEHDHIPQIKYGFHSVEEMSMNSLLFIGLNPSRITENIDNQFYSLQQRNNPYPKYWKAFEQISEATKLEWSHLDLLVTRETNQDAIIDLINFKHCQGFIREQLSISKQIIEHVKPRIIIVTNSISRSLLGKEQSTGNNNWIGYNFLFDEELGTDRIISDGPLKGVPVFFTSMLSGQRALDLGSKQRLIWHIKRVFESIINE